MGVALGWMALALAAVAGAPDAGRPGVTIKYTVRFVEADGVGWREAVFTRLAPVTRQGSATVWTAPHDVARRLVERAIKDPSPAVMRAPSAIAWSGAPVHIRTGGTQTLVTQVAWNGDDRPVEARPETVRTGSAATIAGRKLDQGVLVQMVLHDTHVIAVHRVALGRPAEPKTSPETQKAACRVEECEGDSKCCEASESTGSKSTSKVTFKWEWNLGGVQLPRAQYIHDDVKFLSTCPDAPRTGYQTKKTDSAFKVTGGVVASPISASECGSTTASCGSCCKGDEATKIAVEVPEIGSQEIAGEWLIPKDGILLVSFGPHTVADKDGRAVVRERLAIVEAVESTELAGMPAPQPRNSVPGIVVPSLPAPIYFMPAPLPGAAIYGTPPPPAPAEAARVLSLPAGPVDIDITMPPLPGRSIPQGYHMDGRAADLPPLPPEEADDADSSESAEPRPSPQARKSRQPEPAPETKARPKDSTGDPAMNKAQFTAPSLPTIPSMFQYAPSIGLQFLLPIKPVSFRLPFNRRLEIEIYGRVVRSPEPAPSSAELAIKPAHDGATTK